MTVTLQVCGLWGKGVLILQNEILVSFKVLAPNNKTAPKNNVLEPRQNASVCVLVFGL